MKSVLSVCILFFFMCLYCTNVLTKQGTGVSEGSDLGVRQTSEQGQQGGEKVLVIDEAILTGAHKNPSKLEQASFETLQLGAWGAQRVVHGVLEDGRKQKKWKKHLTLCSV